MHATGWRAEYARILALAVGDDATDFERAMAAGIAQHHQVPLVPFDMLQLEGARHASGVPEALIPETPPANPRVWFTVGISAMEKHMAEFIKSATTIKGPGKKPQSRAQAVQSAAARFQNVHAPHAPTKPRRPPRSVDPPV